MPLTDEMVMQSTRNIVVSFSLGLSVVSAPLAQGGDEIGVELIELPGDTTQFASLFFSDDGELHLLNRQLLDSRIYRYEDAFWSLIRRDLSVESHFTGPSGLSGDGSIYGLSGLRRSEVVEGATTTMMPDYWYYTETRNGFDFSNLAFGSVRGGNVSHDGTVVTLKGKQTGRSYTDSLIWTGGSDLINLSQGLPRDSVSYSEGYPNIDGSVIAFSGDENGASSRIFVWQSGELTEVPVLNSDSPVSRYIAAVSHDGHAVYGNDIGPRRGGISSDPLSEDRGWSLPSRSQWTAWVWTEQAGTTPIIDQSRFLETVLQDTDANGSLALVTARPTQSSMFRQYLWFGDDKFVLLDEVFHTLGISIDTDSYDLFNLSADGTKLMGSATIDGHQFGLVVTLPKLVP
jgi:hypothetical protein